MAAMTLTNFDKTALSVYTRPRAGPCMADNNIAMRTSLFGSFATAANSAGCTTLPSNTPMVILIFWSRFSP
jgi:hypothetical protein